MTTFLHLLPAIILLSLAGVVWAFATCKVWGESRYELKPVAVKIEEREAKKEAA